MTLGYWTTDLLDVNEHFGTEQDIKQLSDELHKRDMVMPTGIIGLIL